MDSKLLYLGWKYGNEFPLPKDLLIFPELRLIDKLNKGGVYSVTEGDINPEQLVTTFEDGFSQLDEYTSVRDYVTTLKAFVRDTAIRYHSDKTIDTKTLTGLLHWVNSESSVTEDYIACSFTEQDFVVGFHSNTFLDDIFPSGAERGRGSLPKGIWTIFGETNTGKTTFAVFFAAMLKREKLVDRVIYINAELLQAEFITKVRPLVERGYFTEEDTVYSIRFPPLQALVKMIEAIDYEKEKVLLVIDDLDTYLGGTSQDNSKLVAAQVFMAEMIRLKPHLFATILTSQVSAQATDKTDPSAASWSKEKGNKSDMMVTIYPNKNTDPVAGYSPVMAYSAKSRSSSKGHTVPLWFNFRTYDWSYDKPDASGEVF